MARIQYQRRAGGELFCSPPARLPPARASPACTPPLTLDAGHNAQTKQSLSIQANACTGSHTQHMHTCSLQTHKVSSRRQVDGSENQLKKSKMILEGQYSRNAQKA